LAAKERHDSRVDLIAPLPDALLGRTTLVVKGHDALGWSRQVGEDEADTRVKLAWMPLDFRHPYTAVREVALTRFDQGREAERFEVRPSAASAGPGQ
jgi:hypothetical protein